MTLQNPGRLPSLPRAFHSNSSPVPPNPRSEWLASATTGAHIQKKLFTTTNHSLSQFPTPHPCCKLFVLDRHPHSRPLLRVPIAPPRAPPRGPTRDRTETRETSFLALDPGSGARRRRSAGKSFFSSSTPVCHVRKEVTPGGSAVARCREAAGAGGRVSVQWAGGRRRHWLSSSRPAAASRRSCEGLSRDRESLVILRCLNCGLWIQKRRVGNEWFHTGFCTRSHWPVQLRYPLARVHVSVVLSHSLLLVIRRLTLN